MAQEESLRAESCKDGCAEFVVLLHVDISGRTATSSFDFFKLHVQLYMFLVRSVIKHRTSLCRFSSQESQLKSKQSFSSTPSPA